MNGKDFIKAMADGKILYDKDAGIYAKHTPDTYHVYSKGMVMYAWGDKAVIDIGQDDVLILRNREIVVSLVPKNFEVIA